jgi:chemotaxis protein CheX
VKVVYINPFLTAASYVFQQFQLPCQFGNPLIKSSPVSGKDILTVVGITGEVRGYIYLGVPMSSAIRIASAMVGGIPLSELDPLVQSAISELSNMICGNALTLLSKEGISLDITPPSLILGKQIEVSAMKMRVLSVPIIVTGTEELKMNIVFED